MVFIREARIPVSRFALQRKIIAESMPIYWRAGVFWLEILCVCFVHKKKNLMAISFMSVRYQLQFGGEWSCVSSMNTLWSGVRSRIQEWLCHCTWMQYQAKFREIDLKVTVQYIWRPRNNVVFKSARAVPGKIAYAYQLVSWGEEYCGLKSDLYLFIVLVDILWGV